MTENILGKDGNINVKMPLMRAMSRKQVRELRGAGHDLIRSGNFEDKEAIAELVDWVLDNVYPDLSEHVDYNQAFWLALNTYRAIYEVTEPEIKN